MILTNVTGVYFNFEKKNVLTYTRAKVRVGKTHFKIHIITSINPLQITF